MCGIVGYKGNRDANQTILGCLKKLEYRGYDSWGIASVGNPSLALTKQVGQIGKVERVGDKESHLGVGHTRWATHGKVNEHNAHPHLDCKGKIAIAHNGIIENFQQLRKDLKERGHSFASETDSEVIAHLAEENYEGNLRQAIEKSLPFLKGGYAIVAIDQDSQEMVGVKKDSPLLVGIGDSEVFLASDVPAFLEYTREVMFLDDGDVVHVVGDQVKVFKDGVQIEKQTERIEWDAEQASKGEYEHFMMKEIVEQNETIARAIAHSDERIMELAEKINNAKGVFFVGCGTSYHAALTAEYIFSKVAKMHVNVVLASEFQYHEHFLKPETLVVPISQSGETADVIAAVKAAKEKGSDILSIVNVMGSRLMRDADDTVLMNAGPEICVLSTKAYTSEIAILTLLAYACAGRLEEGKELLKKCAAETVNLTSAEMRLKLVGLASKIKDKPALFCLGRGVNYPTALEAALKIKEVSYIHATGIAAGESKHGPIALVEEGFPVIVFVPEDETKDDMISNSMEMKSRGAFVIGVAPENNEAFDFHIPVPDVGDATMILNSVVAQILAYYLAMLKGLDADKPKNLAKSVTVK